MAEDNSNIDTSRIDPKPQSISEAYAVPANFLEIDVCNPQTHGVGKKRYSDYEVRMKVYLQLNASVAITLNIFKYVLGREKEKKN